MSPVWLAGALVAGLAFGACGDDDRGDDALPLVGEIGPAVEALEVELGDAPQYFEIRATAEYVTMWIAGDQGRLAIPYPYADGELGEAGDSQAAGGFTFDAAALVFDPEHVLDQIADDLDGSALTQFSIVGFESGDPRYTVTALSERGGEIDIQVDADGTPLEAVPID